MDIYRGSLEPSYKDIDDELAIKPGGILVRKGLYRNAMIGAKYEATVLADQDNTCAFCEPRLSDRQDVTHRGKYFAAFLASAPYEFMGDYPAIEGKHELVVPIAHTEDPKSVIGAAATEIDEYLRDREAQHPTITYARNQYNPSKSVSHLHYHSIPVDTDKKVSRYVYSWQSGVTELEFSEPQMPDTNEPADEILAESKLLTVARPAMPFLHFDGQEVLGHLRLTYDLQNPKSVSALNEQLDTMQKMTTNNQSFQTYNAQTDQNSNVVEVLYLGLNPIYKLEYDQQTGGLAELVFARLSLQTISKIKQLRNRYPH